MRTIFIFAGELSADLHGEKIILELLKKEPGLKIFGVGGPKMRSTGMECILPMEAFQVMGFIDVLWELPKLIKNFFFIRSSILKRNPEACIFIDYADYNMRMEASLRKKKYSGKLIHYISPSVWAWRKQRAVEMSKNLNLLLSILPFEPAYFEKTGLKVKYVGHPLVTRVKNYEYQPNLFPKDKEIISLFPGSRSKEIQRNLKLMLAAASKLAGPNTLIAISISHPRFQSMIVNAAKDVPAIFVPAEKSYDLMKASTLAIAKSGTVTLELALHEVPTVVVYNISTLDHFIAKHLLHIIMPYYCIVNIIKNKEVFPELFGKNIQVDAIVDKARKLDRNTCITSCKEIKHLLGDHDTSKEAALAIKDLLD